MYLKYLKNGKKLMFIMLMLFFSPMALAQTQEQIAAEIAAGTEAQAAIENAKTEIRGLPASQTVLAAEIKAFNLASMAVVAAQNAVANAATPAAQIIAQQNLTTLTGTLTARAEAISMKAMTVRALNQGQTAADAAMVGITAATAQLPAGQRITVSEREAYNAAVTAIDAAVIAVASAATPAERVIALQNLTTLTGTLTATAEAIITTAGVLRTLNQAQTVAEAEAEAAIAGIRAARAGLLAAGQTMPVSEMEAFNAAVTAVNAAVTAVASAPTLEARIIALQNLTTLTRTLTARAEEIITTARAARAARTAPNIDNYRWVASPQVLRTSQIYGAGARQFCGNQDSEVCIGLADKTGAPAQLVKCFIPKNTTECPTTILAANNCAVATLQGL